MSTEMNDQSLLAWILNGVLALGVTVVGWWTRTINTRMAEYEESRLGGYQRIASLEAHYGDIRNRLERIERKVDSLNGTH